MGGMGKILRGYKSESFLVNCQKSIKKRVTLPKIENNMRRFNTSGPNIVAEHYTLPRLDLIKMKQK